MALQYRDLKSCSISSSITKIRVLLASGCLSFIITINLTHGTSCTLVQKLRNVN